MVTLDEPLKAHEEKPTIPSYLRQFRDVENLPRKSGRSHRDPVGELATQRVTHASK